MEVARPAWWAQPVRRGLMFLLVPLFCIPPVWLMSGPLAHYQIRADDFYHFGASRTWDRMASNLLQPHNLHVVAVFRFYNWCVWQVAGGEWQNLPKAAAVAACILFALTIFTCGQFVWSESGRAPFGLAAMVMLGGSTLMYSALTFYAATPAIWVCLAILLTLASLQKWRRSGGRWPMAGAALASLLAIASWSGGYVVAPVGAAYLWWDGRSACRRAAVWFLLAAGLSAGLLFAATRHSILANRNLGGRDAAEAIQPLRGIVHTLHAIPEWLVLRNFGVEAEITESQAFIFCLVLLGLWLWRHHRGVPVSSLEAAGATCFLVSYLLMYTARGYLPFSSLRTTPWYHTVPHLGAVLFVIGMATNGAALAPRRVPLRVGGLLCSLAFALGFCMLHRPMAEQLFLDETFPALSRTEEERLLVPRSLRRDLPWEVANLAAQEQRRVFAQFDRIEATSREFGFSRADLEAEFGEPEFTGVPHHLDFWSVLDLPEQSGTSSPELMRRSLGWIRDQVSYPHLALRPLIESLNDPAPETRTSAAIALSAIGEQAQPAVPALAKLLSDPNQLSRANAAAALIRIDPRSAEKLGLK